MQEAEIIAYVTAEFGAVEVSQDSGNRFFSCRRAPGAAPDWHSTFATLVTNDAYDHASDLDRPAIFRLNIGVEPDTYRAQFGPPPKLPRGGGVVDTGHDFRALDRLLPHPVYAPMSWLCILNPSATTFETLKPLLAEAYARAVRRSSRQAGRANRG